MPGGRPPKPTHLKVLSGAREDRINRNEPVPAEVPVEPPYELTQEVQEVWNRLAPDRIRKGVLTAWDTDAFAFFCEAIVLARRGTVRARNDKPKQGAPSPMSMFKDAMSILNSLGGRFGWTPSDRSKLTIPQEDADDGEVQELLG